MVDPRGRERYDEVIRAMGIVRGDRVTLHGTTTGRATRGDTPMRQGDAVINSMQSLRASCVPIDWSNTAVWVFFDVNFQHTGACRIEDLQPQSLYEIVEYAVTNVRTLFYLYAGEEWRHTEQVPGLAAKRWLGLQPLFRAVVQEAIRKNVAFSDVTYVYLRQFVVTAVNNKPQSATLTPWADEQRRAQQSDLREFLDHSAQVVTEESMINRFGRKGRAIQLDD